MERNSLPVECAIGLLVLAGMIALARNMDVAPGEEMEKKGAAGTQQAAGAVDGAAAGTRAGK